MLLSLEDATVRFGGRAVLDEMRAALEEISVSGGGSAKR